MPSPFKDLKFKFPWRSYQADALRDLETHLSDRKLHLVAPPGAGKTVLGLEVLRQLEKPALVIAPTISIVAQWEDTLRNDFGASASFGISRSLNSINSVTIVTYQGLFAAAKQQGIATIVERLTQFDVQTLVLDEAHHLRNEWWRVLNQLLENFPDWHQVALTGTPPYDVDQTEWNRYHSLCGDIDVEIPIPELVETGELCPHVDLVWLSPPTTEMRAKVGNFQREIWKLCEELPSNDDLANLVLSLPVLIDPIGNQSTIFANPKPLVSAMIFLSARDVSIPADALKLFRASENELPKLTPYWAETLLNHLLEIYGNSNESLASTLQTVRRIGVLHRDRVRMLKSQKMERNIVRASGKLQAVDQIVKATLKQLEDEARVVVLSSTIHREVLRGATDTQLNQLGVAPCFETLRRSGITQMVLLSGTLLVIPVSARIELDALHSKEFPEDKELGYKLLESDSNFLQLMVSDRLRHRMVAWVTQLFSQGHFNVICGTQALLGEGWDAPCINSLVIASNSGSFMLSNQIRGRAIRQNPSTTNKTAAIWHLATTTGYQSFEPDLDILNRRFEMFIGPSMIKSELVSGLDRLGKLQGLSEHKTAEHNGRQLSLANDGDWIRGQWKSENRGSASPQRTLKREVHSTRLPDSKSLFYATLEGLLLSALLATVMNFLEVADVFMRNDASLGKQAVWISIWIAGFLVIFGYSNRKTIRLILKYGRTFPISRQLGESLVSYSKSKTNHPTSSDFPTLEINQILEGIVFRFQGGNRINRLRLSSALKEMLGPIDSPRFLIRISTGLSWLQIRSPLYFPAPTMIKTKHTAEVFGNILRKEIGQCRMVNCRTIDGRAELLRARKADLFRSIAATPPQELSKWE